MVIDYTWNLIVVKDTLIDKNELCLFLIILQVHDFFPHHCSFLLYIITVKKVIDNLWFI